MSRRESERGRKPYVVYWNNIPSPYMVERFNALADRGCFDFEAWFNARIEPDRSWEVDERAWRFRHRYLPVTRMFGRRQHWPTPLLGRRPDVVVSLHNTPVFVVGWLMAKLRGCGTAFRVLKTYDQWVKRTRWRKAVKRMMFRFSDGIETPGNDGRNFAIECGARAERVFIATHTVDIEFYSERLGAALGDRESARTSYGLTGVTFLYVGRLWLGKGLQYLLEAFRLVQEEIPEPVSLLLVGDGADEHVLKEFCRTKGIDNVVFGGFKQKAELPGMYCLADVFVFPTLGDPYGVVVDEAMTCSLPVISTTAAGEITDRVEEGVNGYLVPPADSAALARKMLILAKNGALRREMGKASFRKVQGHRPENWAEEFEQMIDTLLAGRGR